MEIIPIAHFHSPLGSKFGIPRQSGIVDELAGSIVFCPDYRQMDAVRGIEGFDYLWLIWQFSENVVDHSSAGSTPRLTVRPPRLGGNSRMGVFATRSPFRPNALGLSCVRFDRLELHPQLGPVLHVRGADLMDGTPIYDVKPYVPYADSHPDARGGFVDETQWRELEVVIPQELSVRFSAEELKALTRLLALDPRPRYHSDANRVYGMLFAGRNVRFCVEEGILTVVAVE